MEEKRFVKGILEWVRELLGRSGEELPSADSLPTEDVVGRLVDKATGKGETASAPKGAGGDSGGDSGFKRGGASGEGDSGSKGGGANGESDSEPGEGDSEPGDGEKKCCPFAMRRNIVESLREVRRFAEEHNLAETMLRALLTLLAEMALDALKGKVGFKALDALLKSLNYSQHVEEAYIRGKNEKIRREIFPADDDIPHLGGMVKDEPEEPNIFTVARMGN